MMSRVVVGKMTTTSRLHVERFSVVRELRRTGVSVIQRGDVEWFVWRPGSDMIVVNPRSDPVFKRGTVALALAHRALGHWGNTLDQDVEARDLTARWLISDQEALQAAVLVPRIGVDTVAESLQVTPHVVQIRMGRMCRGMTNLAICRGEQCACVAFAG